MTKERDGPLLDVRLGQHRDDVRDTAQGTSEVR